MSQDNPAAPGVYTVRPYPVDPRAIFMADTVNKGRELGPGPMGSENKDGFNGRFYLSINGLMHCIIASDGRDEDVGWEHVSVSIVGSQMPPSWSVMCRIKELFWGPDEWVVQYHPPSSKYINNHPGCLHLWRPTKAELPIPDPALV